MDLPIFAKGVNGTVTFDGRFVTIARTGLAARGTIGKGVKRFPVTSIVAIQWKPPGLGVHGFVAFTLPGGMERTSRFGSQSFDAAKDENAVLVAKGQQKKFLALRDAVEAAMAGGSVATAAAPMPVPPPLAAPVAAAGWFPDPADPTLHRYWDGQQWTAHTAPR